MTTHRILPSDIDKLEAAICTLDIHWNGLDGLLNRPRLREDLLQAKRILTNQMADQPKERANV